MSGAVKRLTAVCTVAAVVGLLVVACGSHQAACALSLTVSGGVSGGRSSGAGSPSGGARTGGAGARSSPGGDSGARPGSGTPGQSKTAQQARASSASKPAGKPAAEDVSKAKAEAPKLVSRGGSYSSPVTGNTYVFHSVSYYRRPGVFVDIFDPYNPYNYWYWPTSPFYGQPYRYATACGGQEKTVQEQHENINITIDDDGKVTQAEDKNPQDPELVKASSNDEVEPGTTETVAP